MEEWQPSLWGRKAGGKEPSNFAASWKGYPGKDRNGSLGGVLKTPPVRAFEKLRGMMAEEARVLPAMRSV
eukprot:6454010-Amphidinium_carterae.1